MCFTAVCSLFAPGVSSGRPGWRGRSGRGWGSWSGAPAGTARGTPSAATACCGACRWTTPPAAWRTAARRWPVAAEARPRSRPRPAAVERTNVNVSRLLQPGGTPGGAQACNVIKSTFSFCKFLLQVTNVRLDKIKTNDQLINFGVQHVKP